MQGTQEHVSPYPPFRPVPMPRNAQEEHAILAIVIVIWVLGFVLMLWIDRKKKR